MDVTKLDMEKMLALIDKERAEKSTTDSSVATTGTSQRTSEALKSDLRNIVGKSNNNTRRQ